MEREVGGGIGMGNTCKPMAVSFQCMTKFTTIKIIIIIKKKDLLEHSHLYYCFCIIRSEMSICKRDSMDHKLKIFTTWSFT